MQGNSIADKTTTLNEILLISTTWSRLFSVDGFCYILSYLTCVV